MNIAKHMEAVFVTALVFAGSLSYAVESLPEARAQALAAAHSTATPAGMPVVMVHAKRMSAAEKAASLRAEQAARNA